MRNEISYRDRFEKHSWLLLRRAALIGYRTTGDRNALANRR